MALNHYNSFSNQDALATDNNEFNPIFYRFMQKLLIIIYPATERNICCLHEVTIVCGNTQIYPDVNQYCFAYAI